MNIDYGYVVKSSNNTYYIGMNQWDNQLRKAKIYHSERYANDIVNSTRFSDMELQLVKIEIREIE